MNRSSVEGRGFGAERHTQPPFKSVVSLGWGLDLPKENPWREGSPSVGELNPQINGSLLFVVTVCFIRIFEVNS